MESYRELRERQQQEVSNFPLGYAFGNKQFKEMMENWGLDTKKDSDLAQVARLSNPQLKHGFEKAIAKIVKI